MLPLNAYYSKKAVFPQRKGGPKCPAGHAGAGLPSERQYAVSQTVLLQGIELF